MLVGVQDSVGFVPEYTTDDPTLLLNIAQSVQKALIDKVFLLHQYLVTISISLVSILLPQSISHFNVFYEPSLADILTRYVFIIGLSNY